MIVYLEKQKIHNRVCIYLNIDYLARVFDSYYLIRINSLAKERLYSKIKMGEPFVYIHEEGLTRFLQE